MNWPPPRSPEIEQPAVELEDDTFRDSYYSHKKAVMRAVGVGAVAMVVLPVAGALAGEAISADTREASSATSIDISWGVDPVDSPIAILTNETDAPVRTEPPVPTTAQHTTTTELAVTTYPPTTPAVSTTTTLPETTTTTSLPPETTVPLTEPPVTEPPVTEPPVETAPPETPAPVAQAPSASAETPRSTVQGNCANFTTAEVTITPGEFYYDYFMNSLGLSRLQVDKLLWGTNFAERCGIDLSSVIAGKKVKLPTSRSELLAIYESVAKLS